MIERLRKLFKKNHKNKEDMEQQTKKINIKRLIFRTIILAGLVIIMIFLGPKALYYLSHESTDDAYVEGTIVPISPEVKGKVIKVFIDDNQFVKTGEPLVQIDPKDYTFIVEQREQVLSTLIAEKKEIEASLEEKKKELGQTKADLKATLAEEDLSLKDKKRYDQLLKEMVVSQSEYDYVESKWKVAKAKREAAQANVAKILASIKTLKAKLVTQKFKIEETEASLQLARIDLERTLILAPITGRVANKNIDPGKYVQPGQPLLSLVDENDIWIVANFKETQIEKMMVGQPVDIKVDAYPGKIFKGHIDSFQPGSGAVFSLLPPENATGNFVKVVQRVPVKILVDSSPNPNAPLWPGLSVIPSVDVTAKEGNKSKVLAKTK